MKTITMLFLLGLSLLAQTTTPYDLSIATQTPNGSGSMICSSNPENCNYYIAAGVFETGGYWTQFDQKSGYNVDYCKGTAVWSVAATPSLGPTASLFTMDCHATDINGISSILHAEIYAHSYVATYSCGARVRTTCHQTRWIIDPGSVLEVTK